MPNHIQNKLQAFGDSAEAAKMFDHISSTDEDGKKIAIDFNKIKPMPEGVNLEVNMNVKMWAEICTGQIDFASLFKRLEASPTELFRDQQYGTLAKRLAASTAMDHLTGKQSGNVKDLSEEDFSAFVQCLKNYREHGATSWYEWCIENWGTKWNAYAQNDIRNTSNTIYFQTAWSCPIRLIQLLSEQFPSVTLVLTYADEDSGSNTGRIEFRSGEVMSVVQPENQSKEGYDIFFDLHPEQASNYRLVDNKYEYVEQECEMN